MFKKTQIYDCYYECIEQMKIRNNGKSTLLRVGIEEYDRPFLYLTIHPHSHDIRNPYCKIITPNNYQNFIRGNRYPIIIDHEFLIMVQDLYLGREIEIDIMRENYLTK